MGAEHSRVTAVGPTAKPNADAGSPSVSWKHLAFGFQYTATDVALWPQCLPLLLWFTEQDALVLYDKLQRRPRTRFLDMQEFRAWLSNADSDKDTNNVLHPVRMPLAPNDIMTPPAVVLKTNLKTSSQQPHASSLLVIDLYLEHVFSTFARGDKLFAMQFLAAMVLGSRAIWSVDHKCHVLLTLFQDTANSSALHPKHQKQQIFKEADLAQLFMCVMYGVCRLTVGVQALWQRHGLDISALARRFAADGVQFALARRESVDNQLSEAPRAKLAMTARELRAYIDATPAFYRFLALFSGEEMRNPFTFGVARSLNDGLFFPEQYRPSVAQQRQHYDRLLKQYVSFEGRDARRRHSSAMLIQSTWRRRCSRSVLQRKREVQQRRRHDSAAMLQNFLRQCQFAKVLEQHAEVETNALNGGVFVAGQGPCVPTASFDPTPLRLVETFKLLNVKISAVAMSRTCAVALQSDRQSIFVWGRCLPRVYADTLESPKATDNDVMLTQATPGKLSFRFPPSAPVHQLACGLSHALVVTTDGNVHSWGFNDHGQLGHGSAATLLARTNGEKRYAYYYDERDAREYEYLPHPSKLVYFQGAPQQQADPIPIQSVVCGDYYSMALSREGDIFTWGEASEGQLGHGDAHTSFEVAFVDKHMLNSAYTFLPEPEPVLALSDRRVVQIACRKNHSVALTEDGRVFEWGNWGKRCGIDKEHAFAPVEMDERLVRTLQLRQISVGDHHMLGEGSSVWLRIAGRVDGLSTEKRVYLACSPSWSCGQDVIDSEYASKSWTCVLADCDVDDIELPVEPLLTETNASETEEGVEQASEDTHALWKKRAEPFKLREPSQIASYDVKFTHVFHCFPGLARKFAFERMLMLWFHTHVQNRLVVMPRGAPAGYYLQIMLPQDTTDPVNRLVQDEAKLEAPHAAVVPPMVEFPVFGSTTARGKATKCGFATHFYHPVMRERLNSLPRRLRKVMPMDFMEPNSIYIMEIDESSFDVEESEASDGQDDRQSRYFTRSSTPDGKQVYEWSELVVDTMTRHVLAAQESGALAVLLVLDFLDADAFELELAEDSGVYVPVFMIKKSTQASRVPDSGRKLTFSAALSQFVASQAFEETEDLDEPPVVPAAWVSRCFERVDTTDIRIQSALANGAAGVVLIQHEQSTEVDGETRGVPIFLDTGTPLSKPAVTQHLVAMISYESSLHLRAASALSLTSRPMPFVKNDEDGAKCELLIDVGIDIRAGGTVYAWGNGQNGRLGLGNPALAPLRDGYEALTDSVYRFADKPTPIMALAGHEMKQLVCGSAHNVAVTELGRVFTWGKGARGELANAKTKDQAIRNAHDQWIPRLLHHIRYDRIVEAAANDASTALLSELIEPQVYLERRKEVSQLKAAARKSLLP